MATRSAFLGLIIVVGVNLALCLVALFPVDAAILLTVLAVVGFIRAIGNAQKRSPETADATLRELQEIRAPLPEPLPPAPTPTYRWDYRTQQWRPRIRGTREMPSGTDPIQLPILLTAASQHR